MHRRNGKRLHDAYSDILDIQKNSSDWYLRADNSDRTIKSGERLVAGIWNAQKRERKSDSSAAFPDLKTEFEFFIDGDDSTPLDPWGRCPRVGQIWYQFRDPSQLNDPQNAYFKELNDMFNLRRYGELINEKILLGTGKVGGHVWKNLPSLGHMVDCLAAHICPTVTGDNKEIPSAFTELIDPVQTGFPTVSNPDPKGKATLLDEILWFSKLEYDIFFAVPEMGRLSGGILARDVIDALENKEKDKKFLLYSGHDSSPMAPLEGLLYAEGLNEIERRPGFASMITMEIGEDKVRFVLDGKVMPSRMCGPLKSETPGICDRAELMENLRASIPTKEECQENKNEKAAENDDRLIVV